MAAGFPYFIAGMCSVAFFILWFSISYKELSRKKQEVKAAAEQVQMHLELLELQEYGSPNIKAAKRMLNTSYMIYQETVKGYNHVFKSPAHHFSGVIMGFRSIPETMPQELKKDIKRERFTASPR